MHPRPCLDVLGEDKKTPALTGNRIAIPRLCRPCLVTILTEISRVLCYFENYLLFTQNSDSVSREPEAFRPHVFVSHLHLRISLLDTTAEDCPKLSSQNKSMAV